MKIVNDTYRTSLFSDIKYGDTFKFTNSICLDEIPNGAIFMKIDDDGVAKFVDITTGIVYRHPRNFNIVSVTVEALINKI